MKELLIDGLNNDFKIGGVNSKICIIIIPKKIS